MAERAACTKNEKLCDTLHFEKNETLQKNKSSITIHKGTYWILVSCIFWYDCQSWHNIDVHFPQQEKHNNNSSTASEPVSHYVLFLQNLCAFSIYTLTLTIF